VCAPVCGDGITLSPETCDDGNNADLDGCSAGCLFEGALNEIEVNDTTADADASPLQLTGSGVVSGAIGVVGDKDFFRLTLASDRVVRFETAETLSPFDCPNLTTTLRLYDSAGVELYFSNTAGIESCSALVLGLSAGTYYVSVEEAGNNGTIAQYYLDVALHADLGSELESNDSMATANAFLGTNVVLSGSHQDGAESDYYLIDIPTSGWSVRAETLEAVGGETCESNGMDTRVSLYDVPGNPFISDDDDAGRGACSRMDGTGGQPSNTGSHDLAAGLYYVRVRAATGAQNDASGQFDYRVALTLRSP
jgi:cysteine-rich repeat protein